MLTLHAASIKSVSKELAKDVVTFYRSGHMKGVLPKPFRMLSSHSNQDRILIMASRMVAERSCVDHNDGLLGHDRR